jgi:predicted membrane-bound spermidine synthase
MKTSQLLRDKDLTIPSQAWGIFLISILGLFLETLFIRWIGTEIRIFAYLQNTILVACFLGLGLGMFTSTKPVDVKQSLVPLTILLVLMVLPTTRTVLGRISEFLSTRGDFLIWGPLEASDKAQQIIYLAAGLALTYGVLILIVDIFVPLGRILGRLMNANKNPIWAYSINILGSIFGSWAFVLFSYLYQPPFVWFLVAAALFACFILWSNRSRRLPFVLLGIIIILSWFVSRVPGALDVIWSPYQKLEVWKSEPNWLGDYQIHVNNSGYQVITDLSDENVSSKPGKFSPQLNGMSQYDIPLLLHPDPKSVLLVGAGAGNDAAGALRHNSQSVTAVEIDPAIISIGRELHPEHPYLSPKVKVVNDDARSFFATTEEKYDVISFGLLDSHTTTSMTNARLDHYVYTRESLIQARSMLKNGGILILTFEVQKPFIADRILIALEEIFHHPPLVFQIPYGSYGFGGVMFVTGDLGSVQTQLDQNPALSAYIQELQKTNPIDLPRRTKVITDDWPYLYLESAKIPVLYYLLIGLMIFVFMRSNRKWESQIGMSFLNRNFWHFFFLGAGFLLLEVQNISKASVVLGNTWQVNAVIISSVLAMALLANWIASKFPKLPSTLVYLLLVGTCLTLYFIDLARFGFLPYVLKATLVGALTSLPMLFSGIVFVRSFAIAQEKSNALGANLIGALIGALLQSITFITGIKALLIVVAGFYFLSLCTSPAGTQLEASIIQEFSN